MRVYVGTYKKYTAGSLFGAWLDIEDYEDKEAFHEACADLHSDEEDPEFMFQDWEGIPDALISECEINEDLWDYLAFDDGNNGEAKAAYVYLNDGWSESEFQDSYRGKYGSWEAMAEELLEETGELEDIPERLRYYFDYAAYARDIRVGGDMDEHNGHFFWAR